MNIVENYFETAYKEMLIEDSNLAVLTPDFPEDMINKSRSEENDWIYWVPVDSQVTDEQLKAFEAKYNFNYPVLYKYLLKYKHFYELQNLCIRFEVHLSNNWQKYLIDLYESWLPERIIKKGLIPFGSECFMDAGPVCFDLRNSNPDNCPVVFWDHEWVNTEKEIQPLFSSIQKMFESLTFAAQAPIDFIYDDNNQDKKLRKKKLDYMVEFLKIDNN